MAQMKQQNNTPEKELTEMEITKLPDTELKTMVTRMLKWFSENFNNKNKNRHKIYVRNEGYTNWNEG